MLCTTCSIAFTSWKQPTRPWVRATCERRPVSNLTVVVVVFPEFLVRVSYVELYNEDIRDLLFEAGPAAAPKLTIGDDPTHGVLAAIAAIGTMICNLFTRLYRAICSRRS